jgi:AAA domain
VPDPYIAAAMEGYEGGKTQPKGNGADEQRDLDIIWADEITIDLTTAGLVDGLLSTTAMTVAYGESGAGKTFVAVDLACRIATQMQWRELDTEQGVVVYIAAESPKSVERRVWAWRHYHHVEHLPVVVVRATVDLLRGGDVEAITTLLATIRQTHQRIALVVIDTLARAMVGNENAPEDMGAFVAACSTIRAAAETSVLIVHHSGKDTAKGARGWSGLRAATDVELEITEGCIKVSKNRDELGGQSYGFKLERVELGTNKKGRMITTCVAVDADVPAGAGKTRKMGANERMVFDSLVSAIADQQDPPPPSDRVPAHAKGCSVSRWQDTAMLRLPHQVQKRKSEAFNRAIMSLVASGSVLHFEGVAWLP